jgi:hypothetical protein
MREMQIDKRTREYLKKWGRREVPTAQITGGKCAPGTYRCLPVLGWIERRGTVPVVGVHFLVLYHQGETVKANLSIAFPVTKLTELHVNSFLCLIGWDGRVWPYDGDKGWPEGSEEDAAQLRALLKKLGPKVGSTLTFPPKPELGAPLLNLPIVKSLSPYPLAPFEPLPEGADSPVVHLERFRALCEDCSPFDVLN